ncbi:hypothetical protein conserved [Leishmania donovani]|uniref:Uncharacterized protein n=2 Tax=Leishmania donovani TaxID=5661 RepID=A0A504X2X5_LEIDO|nr:hypothetical protein CGC20_27635 [Leishmania donovani]CAJ1993853.1 hypothetical protein conserved [Leishmania donovani]
MSMSACRVTPFSAGLQFTRKDVHEPPADTAVDNKSGVSDGEPQAAGRTPVREEARCFESEEERLLWKAARLRHSIETDLVPRQELAERALRHGRRQLVKLQRLLPSAAFLTFRQKCAAWCDRLRLFEELVVRTMLREAVDGAARSGDVKAPARWRKSNQWPAITNFLELQLHLCFAVKGSAAVEASSPEQSTRENSAVYRHLAAIWAAQQERLLTCDLLHRYYTLRDILHGWGNAWHVRASCADDGDNVSSTARSRLPHEPDGSCICPFTAWESLSEVDRLTSYSKICSHHLTEDVVECLEALMFTHFADVWCHVESVMSGVST